MELCAWLKPLVSQPCIRPLYLLAVVDAHPGDFPLRIDFAEFPAGSYSVDITAVDIFNTIAVTAIQYTSELSWLLH